MERFVFFYKIGEGMDTAYKSVTFAAEIGTWLDSYRLDLQGQQVGGGHQNFCSRNWDMVRF